MRVFALPFKSVFAFEKRHFDLFGLAVFLFFFTLHADRLSLALGGMTFRVNNFLALALLGSLLLRFRLSVFCFDKKLLLSLAFITLSILLSLYYSPYQGRCMVFVIWYGFTLLCYFLLPYLLMTLFPERRILRSYWLSFLCLGGYAALQLLLSLAKINDPFAEQRLGGIAVRPNAFAYEPSYYALAFTPFVMAVNLSFFLDRNADFFLFKPLKLKHLLLVNFLYIVSTATSTTFAYIVFCIVLFTLGSISFLRGYYPMLRQIVVRFGTKILIGAFCTALLFPFLARAFFLKFFYVGLGHHSFFIRWTGIVNTWKLFLAHPWIGIGYGAIPTYFYDACLSEDPDYLFFCTSEQAAAMTNPKFFEPTNVFLEILASIGLIGALAFLFFAYSFWSITKKAITHASPSRRHLLTLFLTTTIITFIVLQFNQGLLRTYIWTHLSLAWALAAKKPSELT